MPESGGLHDAGVTALEQLMRQINATNMTGVTGAAADFYNDIMGFAHAVDWNERWLWGLGAFHALAWVFAFAFRKSHDAQMVILLVILGLVYCAEWINTLAREHWQSFAGQDYFDKRGVFVSVMFSANLLIVALFVLINALRTASSLLVKVKRKEIRANARAKKAQEAKAQ